MELHFKEASGNTNEGDVVWIHSSGRQALIADIVSGCEVDKGVDLLGSWLCLNEAEDIFSATWLTEQLHLLLQRSGVQATIGIITKHANEFVLNLVGNIRLYRVESAVTKVAEAGFEIQPTSVIGSEYTPIVKTVTVKTSPHVKYILASDGLDSESMCGLALNADALNSGAMRSKLLPAACDGDWSALIFPMAQSHTFVDEDWPYNPFVGHQEDRIHERRGLSELATALFSDPLFEGFRIVSCPPILGPSSSRLFDGLLVYPFGVIPLELKDHHGEITVEIGTNRRNSLRVKNERGENYFTSPVVKLRESLRRFGDLPQLRGLQTECKNAGLVIFTANHVSVNCGLDGDFIPAPFKGAGEIMVAKTKQVPDLLKDFVRSRFGKKLVPKLSDSDINRLVNAITAVSDEPEQYHQPMLQIGDYCVDIVPINDESSDYYRKRSYISPLKWFVLPC
ncbi:hypothetical protein FJM67_14910 [Maribrevibacterium harenarium]|uniref:Nuclease-like protein n=1 Tax=Maribrevibacterium harenarium TaxID=2589817 RepID=A0A501WJH3_9GAMM|nr:hypothetical protein [Maribrevibacterium harenarium]TPE47181.1 hypothetical protein FJM67_14910 [Maribrevibacterium harenarium]